MVDGGGGGGRGGVGGLSMEVLNCSTKEDPSGRNGQSTTSVVVSDRVRKKERERVSEKIVVW